MSDVPVSAVPVVVEKTIKKQYNRIYNFKGKNFQPGKSGNPAGRPKGAVCLVPQLIRSLTQAGREKNTTYLDHIAEQFYSDNMILSACLKILFPNRNEENKIGTETRILIVNNVAPGAEVKISVDGKAQDTECRVIGDRSS